MRSTSVALLRRERFVFVACFALFACAWPLVTVKRNESVVHWSTCTCLPLPRGHRHYHQYWTRRWHKSHRRRSVPCLPVLIYWIDWKESMEQMVPPRLPTSRQVEVPMRMDDGGVACPRACRPCALISMTMTRHCASEESLTQHRHHHFRRPRRCRRPLWPALVVCFSSPWCCWRK